MVVIRLSPRWLQNCPFFNVVVADSRCRRDGRFIERIGFYNPVAKKVPKASTSLQGSRCYWTGTGAQVSESVAVC